MTHADQWYWYLLVSVVGLVALCEVIWPKRQLPSTQLHRIVGNWGLYGVNSALIAVTALGAASLPAVFAWHAQQLQWGLLNQTKLPFWANFAVSFLLISLVGYVLHRLMHKVPFFWAMHKVHHSDTSIDFSTSVRHHPAETLVSLLFHAVAIGVFGIDPLAAVVVPTAQFMLGFYQHANIRTHPLLDRILKPFIVTGDMHQIHHSLALSEGNSNYGDIVPWWDQMFGTYLANAKLKPENMVFGIAQARLPEQLRLDKLLVLPLK